MAYNQGNNNGPRISNDRFGNPMQLKNAAQVQDKSGTLVDGVYKAYFELGGKLYKVETGNSNKEHKSGRPSIWLKVTLSPKRSQTRQSM